MVDPTLLVAVIGVVASACVALFAVYWGYRYQLRTQREERKAVALSNVMSDVADAYRVAVTVDDLAKQVTVAESWSDEVLDSWAETGVMYAALLRVRTADNRARFGLGLTLRKESPSHPLKGKAARKDLDDTVASIIEVHRLARFMFNDKNQSITRSTVVAEMAGVSKEDIGEIQSLQANIVDSLGVGDRQHEISELKPAVDALLVRLRAAAGVKGE